MPPSEQEQRKVPIEATPQEVPFSPEEKKAQEQAEAARKAAEAEARAVKTQNDTVHERECTEAEIVLDDYNEFAPPGPIKTANPASQIVDQQVETTSAAPVGSPTTGAETTVGGQGDGKVAEVGGEKPQEAWNQTQKKIQEILSGGGDVSTQLKALLPKMKALSEKSTGGEQYYLFLNTAININNILQAPSKQIQLSPQEIQQIIGDGSKINMVYKDGQNTIISTPEEAAKSINASLSSGKPENNLIHTLIQQARDFNDQNKFSPSMFIGFFGGIEKGGRQIDMIKKYVAGNPRLYADVNTITNGYFDDAFSGLNASYNNIDTLKIQSTDFQRSIAIITELIGPEKTKQAFEKFIKAEQGARNMLPFIQGMITEENQGRLPELLNAIQEEMESAEKKYTQAAEKAQATLEQHGVENLKDIGKLFSLSSDFIARLKGSHGEFLEIKDLDSTTQKDLLQKLSTLRGEKPFGDTRKEVIYQSVLSVTINITKAENQGTKSNVAEAVQTAIEGNETTAEKKKALKEVEPIAHAIIDTSEVRSQETRINSTVEANPVANQILQQYFEGRTLDALTPEERKEFDLFVIEKDPQNKLADYSRYVQSDLMPRKIESVQQIIQASGGDPEKALKYIKNIEPSITNIQELQKYTPAGTDGKGAGLYAQAYGVTSRGGVEMSDGGIFHSGAEVRAIFPQTQGIEKYAMRDYGTTISLVSSEHPDQVVLSCTKKDAPLMIPLAVESEQIFPGLTHLLPDIKQGIEKDTNSNIAISPDPEKNALSKMQMLNALTTLLGISPDQIAQKENPDQILRSIKSLAQSENYTDMRRWTLSRLTAQGLAHDGVIQDHLIREKMKVNLSDGMSNTATSPVSAPSSHPQGWNADEATNAG